jgi:hypothetical protein
MPARPPVGSTEHVGLPDTPSPRSLGHVLSSARPRSVDRDRRRDLITQSDPPTSLGRDQRGRRAEVLREAVMGPP